MNQPARDGLFEFVVHGVECGHATVGDAPFDAKAQGQFCLLRLVVQNVGNEARTFWAPAQRLLSHDGAEYTADSAATLWYHSGAGTGRGPWDQINPGNRVEGVVVFDVPIGAQLSTARLHDSMWSGGVTVRLS